MRPAVLFFSALILTQATGSVCLICWMIFRRLLERLGCQKILYPFLKCISATFLAPAAFLALLCARDKDLSLWGGILFWPTPLICKICTVGIKVWAAVAGLIILFRIQEMARFALKIRKERCPARLSVREQYEKTCERLGIAPNRVRLYESLRVPVPMLMGVLRPCILLPAEDYTAEELDVIFLHELTHKLHGDIAVKYLTIFLQAVGWFNPFAWIYQRLIGQWAEFACDETAGKMAGGPKNYFGAILAMTRDRQDTARSWQKMMRYRQKMARNGLKMARSWQEMMRSWQEMARSGQKMTRSGQKMTRSGWSTLRSEQYCSSSVLALLAEKKSDLRKRVERSLRVQRIGSKNVPTRCAAFLLLTLTCLCCAGGTTYCAANLYEAAYSYTKQENWNHMASVREEEAAAKITRVKERGAEMLPGTFLCRVAGNATRQVAEFEATAGMKITVSGQTKAESPLKIGVCSPEGEMQYVLTYSEFNHTFEIDRDGTWMIFVENTDDAETWVYGEAQVWKMVDGYLWAVTGE